MAFADLFTFSRARAAEYRDAAGAVQLALADSPRFDHTAAAEPRGLLIEGRPQFGQADKLGINAAAWPAADSTVLHEYETPAGEIRRRAYYATDPRRLAPGLLNTKGWHRHIGVVPGYLRNRGGYVTFRDLRYELGGVLAVAPYVLLDANAGGVACPLIEG